MYYEITLDGAGFMPAGKTPPHVGGLFVRSPVCSIIITGSDGLLLINDSLTLSYASIAKQLLLVKNIQSISLAAPQETQGHPSYAKRIEELSSDFGKSMIHETPCTSSGLLLTFSGEIKTSPDDIIAEEFNSITPPEREKRLAINALNRMFPPLAGMNVHVDIQFNGEQYLPMPKPLLSQQSMKDIVQQAVPEKQSTYSEAITKALYLGVFELSPLLCSL